MDAAQFETILDALNVGRGDVLFIHSSMNWIGGGVAEAVAIIEALMARVGPEGTICMPSYTWRGSEPGRPPEGSIVDLRRTPVAVGLLPEVFRRWSGVLRSASYWVPVCAWGSQANALLAGQHLIEQPFGPGSTFRKVAEIGGKLVGFGVSLNTSSLSHLPDHDLADLCPERVMSEHPIEGTVIDLNGVAHHTRSYVVCNDVIATYRPSALFAHDAALKESLSLVTLDGVHFFSYPVAEFHRAGVEVGRAFLEKGLLPPWLGGQPFPQR